jgi:hypothetical protein
VEKSRAFTSNLVKSEERSDVAFSGGGSVFWNDKVSKRQKVTPYFLPG